MSLLSNWKPSQRKVAIDLGTAFIRVASRDLGLVTIPVGLAAKTPLRHGVVTDPGEVASLLRPLLNRARRLGVDPRVAVGIPTDANPNERLALFRALCVAGVEEFEIVPEPQAAAVGAGVEVSSPYAQMVVDIGAGVTDCAVIKSGKILHARAVRIGCSTLRERVQAGCLRQRGINLTQREAERLLEEFGVGRDANNCLAFRPFPERSSDKYGISAATVHACIEPCIAEILTTIDDHLRTLPHEIGCEVIESGILLTGGGALLPGMSDRLRIATAIQVTRSNDPLDTVIRGLLNLMDIAPVRRTD